MRGHHANQSPDSTVDTPEWKASYQEGNQDNGSSIPVVKMGDDAPPPGYTGEWRDGGPVISVTEGRNNQHYHPMKRQGSGMQHKIVLPCCESMPVRI
ncbi:hypothetical protein DAQ1742_02611 [Dickeya aquatica]|uniref:Uncharacterized protein n=1 Tax=Dickeya aquatica TaxID=1401087 RepID=A0A375ABJ5_9GAMM|nr:hypothetical protein DAQ1742_02611 [Dickeya aquatica]